MKDVLVKPIPEGYHTITPYLVVKDAPGLITFLQKAFAASELTRSTRPDGTIMNAEIRIGDSMMMIAEASESYPAQAGMFYLYVPDTDAVYQQALRAGATSIMEPADQFYGDRNAGVQDACGNQWWIATHIEDVTSDELERRAAEKAK